MKLVPWKQPCPSQDLARKPPHLAPGSRSLGEENQPPSEPIQSLLCRGEAAGGWVCTLTLPLTGAVTETRDVPANSRPLPSHG